MEKYLLKTNSIQMSIPFFKIALRNIRKNFVQSFVGIWGLVFGLLCFVPALYWLRYEVSYDCFYPDSDRIYRIYSYDKQSGKTNDLVSGILNRELHDRLPAMQHTTVFFVETNHCSAGNVPYVSLRTVFTDSTFFSVFPQTVLAGNSVQPLPVANNMALTESMAVRLFGSVQAAIGQGVKSQDLDESYTVTAVVKDPPVNTNVPFDALLFHSQVEMQKNFVDESGQAIWAFAMLQMYVKLPPHMVVKPLLSELREYPSVHLANENVELCMLPIGDVRFMLNRDTPFTLNFIHLFVISGLLLLGCALFNFLSLHTGMFRQRIREFRLRAVNGATRSELIRQMLAEQTYVLLVVLLLAAFLVITVCPIFSRFLGLKVELGYLIRLLAICGAGVLGVVWIAGFFFFDRLSRSALFFRSKAIVSGHLALQSWGVILQLVVSIVFIIVTSVVLLQMRFIGHKDLGFDREGLIYLSGISPFRIGETRMALKDCLDAIPQIENVSETDLVVQHNLDPFKTTADVVWPGKQPSEKKMFNFVMTDPGFAETFQIGMKEGRWFEEGDQGKIILNEEAARVMGLDEPISSVVRLTLNETKDYSVVGVVRDFHTLSFRNRIQPMLFVLSDNPAGSLYMRVTPGMEQEVIRQLNQRLSAVDASFWDVHPLEVSELYDRLNDSEQTGLKLLFVLSVVCLLISVFGVYAVATATMKRRRKEIAIRKVVGADTGDIIYLFFRHYILQVVVAGIIGIPIAYAIMNSWLQGYAYRTDLPGWLFVGIFAGIVVVVLLTVWGQIKRAADSNPAEVVKCE